MRLKKEKKFVQLHEIVRIYVEHMYTFMYYLIYEHECFIRYKTRGAAESIISDKARIASILNGLKNNPFYTHLVSLFAKEFSI